MVWNSEAESHNSKSTMRSTERSGKAQWVTYQQRIQSTTYTKTMTTSTMNQAKWVLGFWRELHVWKMDQVVDQKNITTQQEASFCTLVLCIHHISLLPSQWGRVTILSLVSVNVIVCASIWQSGCYLSIEFQWAFLKNVRERTWCEEQKIWIDVFCFTVMSIPLFFQQWFFVLYL